MTHDHTLEPESSLPPFYEVVYLMAADASALPVDSLLAFSAIPEMGGAADSAWTIRADLAGRFLRASASTAVGATGGTESHAHGGYAGVETGMGIFSGSYGMTVTSHGPSTTDMNHSHAYEHDHTLSDADQYPPFFTVMWGSPVEEDRLPMSGAIGMWSGALDEIPRGWVLCDGSGDTPNLSGLFLWGTASEEAIGAVGGGTEHTHSTDSDPGGITSMSGGGNGQCSGGGSLMGFHDHDVPSHDHTMAPASNVPPYFALAFIMYTGG
jgi:hypothetical protein